MGEAATHYLAVKDHAPRDGLVEDNMPVIVGADGGRKDIIEALVDGNKGEKISCCQR